MFMHQSFEFFLNSNRDLSKKTCCLIEQYTVVENQISVIHELLGIVIQIELQFFFYSAEIHGVFDDLWIVRNLKFHHINWVVENSRIFAFPKSVDDFMGNISPVVLFKLIFDLGNSVQNFRIHQKLCHFWKILLKSLKVEFMAVVTHKFFISKNELVFNMSLVLLFFTAHF